MVIYGKTLELNENTNDALYNLYEMKRETLAFNEGGNKYGYENLLDDTDFFTPIFVMSRITGWSAHIMEQHNSNKLIRPLSKYKGKEVREVMLLNQR